MAMYQLERNLNASGRKVNIKLPIKAPTIDPLPPMRTITRIFTDSKKLKMSGLMYMVTWAYKLPAIPE
jgi:hypothetical protein